MSQDTLLIVSIVLGVVAILIVYVLAQLLGLYIQARAGGAPVPFGHIVGMRLRRVDARKVVDVYIRARAAGLSVSIEELETHVLAGGRVNAVVSALIDARGAGLDVSWTLLTALDFAGRDPQMAVRALARPAAFPKEYADLAHLLPAAAARR